MLHGGIQIQTTRLGLFDDQMKCVSWIYLYDSWLSTVRGYLNTAYYPESGGAHYQSSGDIYSSFDRTAAVWYDRNSNSILSAIDGNVVTLAPAYNASRIISYLVIQTQRYDDKTLLDMRVHEINVLANVRATLPWVPEIPPDEEPQNSNGLDGTYSPTSGSLKRADVILSVAFSLTSLFWTGPWPELHYVFTATTVHEDVQSRFHMKYSLLHEAAVEEFESAPKMAGIYTSFWDEVQDIAAEFILLTISLAVALWAWRTLEMAPETGLGVLAIALTFTVLSVYVPFAIASGLLDVGIDLGWLAAVLYFQALMLLYVAFGNIILHYIWMIFTGFFIGYLLFDAFRALVACCEGSLIVRFIAFVIAIAYIVIASEILVAGGPFLVR